jgi:hypothetical protein
MVNSFLLWFILLSGFYLAYLLGRRGAALRLEAVHREPPVLIPADRLAACEARLRPYLTISGHRVLGKSPEFDGRLTGRPEEVFPQIQRAFAGEAVSPMLLEGDHGQVRVVLAPGSLSPVGAPERPNWALHWSLFFAAVATTTWAGALQAGVNLLHEPRRFAVGLPYSVALMLILGAHELGHYFTAKAHGIRVTPPYFIPVPFALGTFGAFIRIKSLSPDRRALFDVAVAGPLMGLVFAVPALLFGLRFSQVIPGRLHTFVGDSGVNVDSSLLLAVLARLSLGTSVLAGDHLVLNPLAFAGWLGLIVTALNLMPIGQLDGGHISHALFGSRHAHGLSMVAIAGLFLLALFVWPGLMFWAFIVFFLAGTHDLPAANDVSPVGWGRTLVGYGAFLLLVLIVLPVPPALSQVIGVHSPYL